jgi:hypothetical protein
MPVRFLIGCLLGIVVSSSVIAIPQSIGEAPDSTGVISGRVILDDQPVPNIKVIVDRDQEKSFIAVTDAEGRYKIENLPIIRRLRFQRMRMPLRLHQGR